MDFTARRLRSTITNENSIVPQKPTLISKNGGGALRPQLVSLNTQHTVGLRQQIKATRHVARKAEPVERYTAQYPHIVGMEREFEAADYADDIEVYRMQLERDCATSFEAMAKLQGTKVTHKMRSILVDWMVQVHERFHLVPETLHLTIYLIDRMLQTRAVEKSELQLIGISCMLAASKYEEIYAPEIADFEYITDNAYQKASILEMERAVIHAADFVLARPHSIQFLRSLVKRFDCRGKTYHLAKYIAESCMLDQTTCYMLPSQQACASLYIASVMCNEPFEVSAIELSYRGEYTMDMVKVWAATIADSILKLDANQKLKALKTKFSNAKCLTVAEFSEESREALSAVAANL